MRRVLMFGSRSLTWRHYEVLSWLASHALLAEEVPLPEFIRRWTTPSNQLTREEQQHVWQWLPASEPIVLLNGDGPPSPKVRGAVGADKLAVFACMQRWPAAQRRMRWFPPEPQGDETWGEAAARRDVEMAEARPERCYCVHTDLEASKGSIITANALRERGLPFWYVKVSAAGEVLSMEERR